ncbi:hypothetical protein CALK_1680 [Chitinivibrio alkaliphilus ACht1]|uniref:Uncharacterized protein n=2 Tax=Chitinivibrio TaxID=1505231 RepID=U7D7C3_9BACT|nr:hypothetical protein CALK_1680 [Chitinivibrio alkaliphilus ACht1]
MITKYCTIFFLFGWTLSVTASTLQGDSFRTHLAQRNSILTEIFHHSTPAKEQISPETTTQFEQQAGDSLSYYVSFLKGLAQPPGETKALFEKAKSRAMSNPTHLWSLFTSFERYNISDHAEDVLDSLYKIQISSGSIATPLVEHLFINLSRHAFSQENYDDAERYLSYAERFSTSPCLYERNRIFLPHATTPFLTTLFSFKNCFTASLGTWHGQLSFISALVSFLSTLIHTAVYVLLFVLLIRYYSVILHKLSCLYPRQIPYYLRITYVVLPLLCLLIFFSYPLFFATALFIIIFAEEKKDHYFALALVVGLMSMPLLRTVNADRTYLESPEAPHALYIRSLEENTDSLFRKTVYETLENDTYSQLHRALLYTSLSLSYAREEDFSRAAYYSDLAVRRKANCKPSRITAGPMHLLAGDIDAGLSFLEEAQEQYPQSAAANYNYSRGLLEYRNERYSGEYFRRAAQIDGDIIGRFTDENTRYFGKQWPPLRRYILGEFSPHYLWKNIGSLLAGRQHRTSLVWGYQFFHISLLPTLIILVIATLWAVVYKISHGNKRSSVGACSLCGRKTCRKCREGEYCLECKKSLGAISNSSLVESMKIKISLHKRFMNRMTGIIMNLLVPGSKVFFLRDTQSKNLFPFFMTIVVYTLYATILSTQFTLYFQRDTLVKLICMAVLSLYNIFFLVQFFHNLKHEITTGRK